MEKLKNNKLIKQLKEQIKKLKLEKNKYNALELILIFIMALLFGVVLGELIFSDQTPNPNTMTEKYDSNIEEIEKVYNTLQEEYKDGANSKILKDAAIKGMMGALGDDYSTYYNQESSEKLKEELEGEFYGMGTEIYKDETGKIIVNNVFEGSPAEKAGMKKGDIYLKINGKDIKDKSTVEISEMIKGKNKKDFIITVNREGKEIDLKVTTAKVSIPTVTSEVIEKENQKIGYIYVSLFAKNTDTQFRNHLSKIKKQGVEKIILDLRDNVGGELESVTNIASEFLNKEDVILQRVSKNKTTKIYSKKNNNKKYKVVVLINGGSASGAEVLSSSLNEYYDAELVGTTTFGKGTVQKTKTLTSGAVIKYTIETWKTGKGKEINKKGVEPTIKEELNEIYYKTHNKNDDNQYQKAIEVILNK